MTSSANTGRQPSGLAAIIGAATATIPIAWRWLWAFARTPGRIWELARYTGVSAAALTLDLGVFFALQEGGWMNPALAGATSCMAGLVLHYLLSVTLVFNPAATGKSQQRLIGEYALTGAMGFAITAGSIFVVIDLLGLPATFGKLVGIGLTFVSVYLVRAGFVFAPRAQVHDGPQRSDANIEQTSSPG